ncbi:hypothetical protein ABK040_001492 [Willaertia magna]
MKRKVLLPAIVGKNIFSCKSYSSSVHRNNNNKRTFGTKVKEEDNNKYLSNVFSSFLENNNNNNTKPSINQYINNNINNPLYLIFYKNSNYGNCLKLQEFLQSAKIKYKQPQPINNNMNNKNNENNKAENNSIINEIIGKPQYLILTEHSPACFTIGKLRFQETFEKHHFIKNKQNLQIFKIGRGGGITFHSEGQLVIYPIFDLESKIGLNKNIKWFTERILQWSLNALQNFTKLILQVNNNFEFYLGEESEIGIYCKYNLKNEGQNNCKKLIIEKRKIASMGLQFSRWISMHGIAINLNLNENNLDSFRSDIVACGLENVIMTSLQKELNIKFSEKDLNLFITLFLNEVIKDCKFTSIHRILLEESNDNNEKIKIHLKEDNEGEVNEELKLWRENVLKFL